MSIRLLSNAYQTINKQEGKKQYLVPYLMSSHPGSTLKEAVELAEYLRDLGYMPEQVQDFYPTPSTISTCMYYTGLDPRNMEPVYVPVNPHEKAMQRALIQYRDPKLYDLVEEALRKAGRTDLIGYGPKCLIRPVKPKKGREEKEEPLPGPGEAGRRRTEEKDGRLFQNLVIYLAKLIAHIAAVQMKKDGGMMMYQFETMESYDPELAKAMEAELNRQRDHIELIASENFVSKAVMEAMGSPLTNKYAEGYPGKRYYGGCEYVDVVEDLARERAKKLFGCEYVNVQPHSGAQANMAVFFAVMNPGDTFMGMSLDMGGHLTHGSPVNMSGKYFHAVPYGITPEGYIDYEEVRKIALECRPKMIVAGASAYPRAIDFKKFREIADEVGAVLMVDMAHIAGLVAAGLHMSPIPYADVTTTTTHKTSPGSQGRDDPIQRGCE